MSKICDHMHQILQGREVFHFPFDNRQLPRDGIYMLYERGEKGHGGHRIVRVGSHTGVGNLPSRLNEHFVRENKDRSIFRKNIGRAILSRREDPFLKHWDLDLTSRAAKDKYASLIDFNKQAQVEREVTAYIQDNLFFVVIPIPDKDSRLALEVKAISTVSWCTKCRPSSNWLGRHSPKQKIRESGLWQVNRLFKEPLSPSDLEGLEALLR